MFSKIHEFGAPSPDSFWAQKFICLRENYARCGYTNFFLLFFTVVPAGNALPAKFLSRNYIFGRGANCKCPAPENFNSAAATSISLIPKIKDLNSAAAAAEIWNLPSTNVSLIPKFKIRNTAASALDFRILNFANYQYFLNTKLQDPKFGCAVCRI